MRFSKVQFILCSFICFSWVVELLVEYIDSMVVKISSCRCCYMLNKMEMCFFSELVSCDLVRL